MTVAAVQAAVAAAVSIAIVTKLYFNISNLIKSCTLCAALLFCGFEITQAQTFDLYAAKNPPQTKSSHPSPVIIFVHGGAWLTGDKSEYQDMALNFTRHGVCFMAINYQLAPVSVHPQPVENLKKILAEIKNIKNEPTCDFEKLYLVGHSAGGHLIAFWATQNDDSRVKGFVGISGIYDVAELALVWPKYTGWFIKPEFGDEKNWPAASPTKLEMKSKAPWILIHSRKDELVDQKQSLDFIKSLKKQKIEAEFSDSEQETHFGIIQKMNRKTSLAVKKIIKFTQKKKSA